MESLKKEIAIFAKEREWDKYHSAKNIAMALTVEASELLEIFLWLSDEESQDLSIKQFEKVKEEIGDIMIYLINLTNRLDIDPVECAKLKIELNKIKYPIDIVKGSAKKYSEY